MTLSTWIAETALNGSSDVRTAISDITSTIIKVFSPWGFALFFIVWIYGLLKKWLYEKEISPNIPELTRLLVLLSLFFSYNFIAPVFQYVVNNVTYGTTQIFDQTSEDFATKKVYSYIWSLDISLEEKTRLLLVYANGGIDKLNVLVQELNEVNQPTGGPFAILKPTNLLNFIINTLSLILGEVVKFVCYMLIFGADLLLYTLGPLAILFSMIPVFKDKFYSWLGTWLVVKFSFLSLVIIETIIHSMMFAVTINTDLGLEQDSIYIQLGTALMSSVLSILSFWFTSKFIGSGDAGKVLSTAAAVMKMAAIKGISSTAQSGGSSLGGTIQALGNIGKGSVKDNKPNE